MTVRLHELGSIKKRSQRIGRSGKRGSYSGRGVTGQKSRSGRRLRPAERDLILRLPKRRGFQNLPKWSATTVFNVGDLSGRLKSFVNGKAPLVVNREVLKVAGLLDKNFKGMVKLLGKGEIGFPMKVSGIMVSAAAKAKIEKVGGAIEK